MDEWREGKDTQSVYSLLSVQKHAACIVAPPRASTVSTCQVLVDLAVKRDPYYEVQERECGGGV